MRIKCTIILEEATEPKVETGPELVSQAVKKILEAGPLQDTIRLVINCDGKPAEQKGSREIPWSQFLMNIYRRNQEQNNL